MTVKEIFNILAKISLMMGTMLLMYMDLIGLFNNLVAPFQKLMVLIIGLLILSALYLTFGD